MLTWLNFGGKDEPGAAISWPNWTLGDPGAAATRQSVDEIFLDQFDSLDEEEEEDGRAPPVPANAAE